MPIRFERTAAPGVAYIDIRVGGQHTIHQIKLNATALAASRDADGNLPPGLGIAANGTLAHTSGTAVCVIGPDAVRLGSVDIFASAIFSGGLNGDAIADNVGSALAATLPASMTLF